jgi:hypothetical protein
MTKMGLKQEKKSFITLTNAKNHTFNPISRKHSMNLAKVKTRQNTVLRIRVFFCKVQEKAPIINRIPPIL